MDKKILLAAALFISAILLIVILFFPSPQNSPATVDEGSAKGERGLKDITYASLDGSISGNSSERSTGAGSAVAGGALAGSGPSSLQASGQAAAGGVETIIEQIDDAVVTYSPEGVDLIAPHLSSSNPEVRDAAIEGLMQLGEPAGVKLLRKRASETTDMRFRARLLEAAAFIELPAAQLEPIQN